MGLRIRKLVPICLLVYLKQYRLFSGFLPQDIPLDAIHQLTNAVRHVLGCAQAEYLIQLLKRQILCLWDEQQDREPSNHAPRRVPPESP